MNEFQSRVAPSCRKLPGAVLKALFVYFPKSQIQIGLILTMKAIVWIKIMKYYCTKFRDLGPRATAAHTNRGIVFIQLYNSQDGKSTLTLFSTFDMYS